MREKISEFSFRFLFYLTLLTLFYEGLSFTIENKSSTNISVKIEDKIPSYIKKIKDLIKQDKLSDKEGLFYKVIEE